VTVDIASPEGQALLRELVRIATWCWKTYKVGQLKRYGLDYDR
jgi:crotonobetainyl-CoA:carnitine CoA-transferase CaiB-like acyl-CoA transferase